MKIRVSAAAKPSAPRDWSDQQEAVFERVANGTKPLVVRARAGSGKTTTLIEALERIPKDGKRILLCAFNKSIADELRRRAPMIVDVKTLHAFGYAALRSRWRNVDVDARRGKKLLREALKARKQKCGSDLFGELADLMSLCKARLEVDAGLITKHVIGRTQVDPERAPELAGAILDAMRAACQSTGVVDYDDMVFVPAVVAGIPIPRYDVVFVDETQDMNRAQLTLARRAGGRLIAVGDDLQGIYGWNGADTGFMDRMVHELDAEERRLSVTYRCPHRVIRLIRPIVSDLAPRPGAPEGLVRTVEALHFGGENGERSGPAVGDVILSRYNAPLAKIAMKAFRLSVPIRFAGKDFARGITELVRNAKAKTTRQLLLDLDNAVRQSQSKCAELEEGEVGAYEEAVAAHEETVDRTETIRSLCEGLLTTEQLIARVQGLTGETSVPSVLLSTVHMAKGLEWDRVWLLISTFSPERNDEERNLWYVAVTRTKSELYLVITSPDGRVPKSRIVRNALLSGSFRSDIVEDEDPVDTGPAPSWLDDGPLWEDA